MSEDEDASETAARLRIVGTVFAFLGTCFLVFITCLAIAHYGYGTPVYRRHTIQLASEGAILFAIVLFGAVGIGAVLAGLAMRRRANAVIDDETP